MYDPKNFKKLGEARLVCDDVFRGNKTIKKVNSNYPLLTDGECLFALLMTVEKRERIIKEGMVECHQALKKAQLAENVAKDAKKEKEKEQVVKDVKDKDKKSDA